MATRNPGRKTVKNQDVKYLCPYCRKEQKETEFYASSDPLVLTGKTVMCKDCAAKIARRWDYNTHEFGDCTKESVMAALERLDKPFLNDLWDSSYFEFVNGKKKTVWDAYIKNITSLPQYRGLRWRDGDLYENYKERALREARLEVGLSCQDEAQNKNEEISEEYEKNRRDVVRLLGYDPFIKEDEEDKPLLYSQLIGYLDLSGDNDDMMRTSSAITIVRGFLQQSKLDDMIANAMNSPTAVNKSGEIKSYLDSKKNVSATISQLAEQSCLSMKHNKNASKGENTFTGKTKRLKDMNLREAENNAFDIGTCKGMQQVADISNASILKQIHLDENDYTEMLGQQREMIVKLQRQADENMEKARILLRENVDLKNFIQEQGIDISEYMSDM